MRKKYIWSLLISCILTLSLSVSVCASESRWSNEANLVDADVRTIMASDNVCKVNGTARGRVISSAGLEISTDGDGILGIYADTLCHGPVEQIYMVIYLDVWDEATQDWKYVNDYEFDWKSADNPGIDLTSVSVSFDVEKLQRGRTYSLRGYFVARDFDSVMEAMSIDTVGLELD